MKITNNNRREFLKKSIVLSAAVVAMPSLLKSQIQEKGLKHPKDQSLMTGGKFEVPPLPYAYEALEPHIDKMTMQIHHDKHHGAYVENLNKACAENKIDTSLDDIIKNISKYPAAVRN